MRQHGSQAARRKKIDPSAQQIGDPRLRDPAELVALLRETSCGDRLVKLDHQVGANPQPLGLFRAMVSSSFADQNDQSHALADIRRYRLVQPDAAFLLDRAHNSMAHVAAPLHSIP